MISIQKQVLLLSEFHFKEFSEYLINTNADLPYKLVTTIRHSKKHHESDELCTLIYGDAAEKTKKKFFLQNADCVIFAQSPDLIKKGSNYKKRESFSKK